MNIDCFLQQEPLDKLVPAYIELEVKESDSTVGERGKKEVTILNSILISLASQKEGLKAAFTEIKYSLEVNQNDRRCMERAALLLTEIIRRSPHLLLKAPNSLLQEIVTLACQKAFIAVCGNSFITLLNQICFKVDLSLQKQVAIKLLELLVSPKLLVSTYRQQTRLCLYKLYLKVLSSYVEINRQQGEGESNMESIFIQRCVTSGSGEKDPRNIGSVFELYLKLLEMFSEEKLSKHRTVMFQNLESYYPIQFVGDEENEQHRKINIKEISGLLNQCLTHSFFKDQTWQLFSSKTAAPPIAPFVPTFLLYLAKRRKDTPTDQMEGRLKNMLVRLSSDSFIEQDYVESEIDLGHVFIGIFDCIFCRNDLTYSIVGFDIVMGWLQTMVKKVIVGECKHIGAMMSIFRSIVKSSRVPRFRVLVQLFRSYSLRSVIKVLKNQEGIIPKLGLAIVALSEMNVVSEDLKQIIGMLVLQVGKIYPQVGDEIKMLFLKILLQAYRGCPDNRLMVRTTNDSFILKDCLARAKQAFSSSLDSSKAFMVKAFIDVVSVVYLNRAEELLANIEGINFELQTYLVGRLFEALQSEKDKEENGRIRAKIVQKFDLLVLCLKTQDHKEEMVRALKAISPQCCFELLAAGTWSQRNESAKLIENLLFQLKYYIQKGLQDYGKERFFEEVEQNSIKHKILSMMTSNEVKTLIENTKEQQLWMALSGQNQIMVLPSLQQLTSLKPESFQFDQGLILGYQPTLIHWLWDHWNRMESVEVRQRLTSQLVKHLPQKILLRDSEAILQLIVRNEKQTSSLLKIVTHLEFKVLQQTGVISYCLDYIQKMREQPQNCNKSTERTTCILAVLITLLEKDQSGELKERMRKSKKQLSMLLLSRKRPIRQALRKMILIIQE